MLMPALKEEEPRRGPRRPLETGKGKEIDSPLELPERK